MHDKRRFALCALLISLVATLARAQVYSITDLGLLSPTAINIWGQVVGNLNGQAFIWTRSAGPKGLGTLAGGTSSYATSINDLGVVTGTADGTGTVISTFPSIPNQQCSDLTQPFVWTQRNNMQGLGAVAPPFSDEDLGYQRWCEGLLFHGTAINALPPQVVGFVEIYGTFQWAFLWTPTAGLSVFEGSWPTTFVNAISNAGQIVGQNSEYLFSIFLEHATSWKNGVATDLGTLGGTADEGYPFGYSSSANGVNDLGQIVGWSTTAPIFENFVGWTGSSPIHAILWPTSGGMSDLGTLPGDEFSAASKINFFGQAIGISGNTAAYDSFDQRDEVIGRPFVWTQRSGMQDLNTLISANSGA